MKKFLLFSFLAFLSTFVFSQGNFSVTYDFASVTSTSGRTDPTTPPTFPNLIFSNFTSTGEANNPNAGGRFSFQGWPTGATNGSDSFTGSIDLNKYYEVTITPASGYAVNLANLTFTLQRSGTGIRQYAVRSNIDNYASNLEATISSSNTNLSVVPTNVFQVTDATTTAQNGSTISFGSNHNSTNPIIIRFYGFNSESGGVNGGTFSIDNVVITGSTTVSSTDNPTLSSNPSSLAFDNQNLNTTSIEKALELTYSNLTNTDLNLSTTAPFSISKTSNGTYGTSLIYAEGERTSPTTIYVKYTPTAVGNNTGNLSVTGAGLNSAVNIGLTGYGIDPNFEINADYVQSFDDANYLNTSHWKQVSVKGSVKTWEHTTTNAHAGNGAAYMNGFNETETDGDGNQPSDDWLISPKMNLNSFSNYPIVNFWTRKWFTGPDIKVYVSTTYDGADHINMADWTELTSPGLPTTTGTWVKSNNLDLSAYKTAATYIAFRYVTETASNSNAAEWRVDDFSLTNQTATSSIPTNTITFAETDNGAVSPSKSFSFTSSGYGDITINTTGDFELSLDNNTFQPSVVVPEADAVSAKTIYARFKPTSSAAQISSIVTFSGSGFNANGPQLWGSSLLKANTFDLATWNMEFFGNGTTIPNYGPANRTLQISNASIVYQKMLPDVIGIQEISDETAVDELLATLPSTYKKKISQVYSYSIKPNTSTDPFPAQKIGFIYNSATVDTVGFRAMFVGIYKNAVAGDNSLINDSFWSSGRLPFVGTFNVTTLDGLKKKVNIVVIHAKSGSATADYNRRKFDIQVLKDSLDAKYPGENNAIIGDYNDLVLGSIAAGQTSPFKIFTDDGYNALTLPLLQAGKGTYVGGTNPSMIDNIIVSNQLNAFYATNSTAIEDARDYISGYSTNTSDHLAVYARFNFPMGTLPIDLANFDAKADGNVTHIKWTTLTETNNDYFTVERSNDGKNFITIKIVKGAGSSEEVRNYEAVDENPMNGVNYYRLKQTDFNGKYSYSEIKSVKFANLKDNILKIYPNPVINNATFSLATESAAVQLLVSGIDGKVVLRETGSVNSLNQKLNNKLTQLHSGVYILQLTVDGQQYQAKFIKQ